MKNERGLTLVELLAVIVILAIIAAIAIPSVLQVINNSKADAHLANARTVLEAGKLAHATGDAPTHSFDVVMSYTLEDLVDIGLLNENIKNPSIFSWESSKNVYDLKESLVVVDNREKPIVYKVNLSFGGSNYIFSKPEELQDINRDAFTQDMEDMLNLKKSKKQD